jgi:hypothetical protein
MREIFLCESVRTGIAKAGKRSWFINLRADDMVFLVHQYGIYLKLCQMKPLSRMVLFCP